MRSNAANYRVHYRSLRGAFATGCMYARRVAETPVKVRIIARALRHMMASSRL